MKRLDRKFSFYSMIQIQNQTDNTFNITILRYKKGCKSKINLKFRNFRVQL